MVHLQLSHHGFPMLHCGCWVTYSIYYGRLFVCFVVLFVTLRSSRPHGPPCTLGIIENPWWVEVHWGSCIMFRLMVWELLNFELIYRRKLNKIKTKKKEKGDLGKLLVWLESPQWVGFYGGNFVISRHKVWLTMNFE